MKGLNAGPETPTGLVLLALHFPSQIPWDSVPEPDCTLESPGELSLPRSHLTPVTSECPYSGSQYFLKALS